VNWDLTSLSGLDGQSQFDHICRKNIPFSIINTFLTSCRSII